jgi:hypothetical protein
MIVSDWVAFDLAGHNDWLTYKIYIFFYHILFHIYYYLVWEEKKAFDTKFEYDKSWYKYNALLSISLMLLDSHGASEQAWEMTSWCEWIRGRERNWHL